MYRLTVLLVVMLLTPGLSLGQETKTVRITPEWIKKNRGRIEISGGSAISGREDQYVKLSFAKSQRRRIYTKYVAEKNIFAKEPPDLSMYETVVETGEPTKSVILRFSQNKPYSLKTIFRIVTIVNPDPELPDLWKETVSYVVDFRDVDSLGYALYEQEKR